jgi:DNA polymerase III gamma/tau subunit
MSKQALFERYRPQTWSDVVGQDKAVQSVRGVMDRKGAGGSAFWITGQSGTGKTTMARLIASEIADSFWVDEMDAGQLTMDRLSQIESEMTYYGGGKGGRAFIINEAHGLRAATIRRLLCLLEPIPSHVVFIFTTTNAGRDKLFEDMDDAAPLLSRCVRVDLAQRDLAQAFAERARTIAQTEGLDGHPIERYIRLAKDCRNNLRMMLTEIESGKLLA